MNKNESGYRALSKVVAERPGDIIAIVGAGLSAQSGLPTWKRLVELLIDDYVADTYSRPQSITQQYATLDYNALRHERDLWGVMKLLSDHMPPESFKSSIRKHLRSDNTPEPPKCLVDLWRIGIKGIITPNLDPLAQDAFARWQGRSVDHSTARSSDYLRFLSDERKFVFQPHGSLSNPDTWIFTPTGLTKLLQDPRYKDWWGKVLFTKTLLLVGVNESDISLKSYLLAGSGGRTHFIVAPVESGNRLTLFESGDFMHVSYSVKSNEDNEDHSEVVELIASLVGQNPVEIIPPSAYSGESVPISSLPTPDELRLLPIESVRSMLNAAVASILPDGEDAEESKLTAFDELRRQYLASFNLAATIEPETDFDLFHGYKVLHQIGEGGFGKVYMAQREGSDEFVALKVIHSHMLSQGTHLNAFRRGAYAMKLLTEGDIPGMVKIVEAFEVPFAIVMDYVPGLDLEKAVEEGILKSLAMKLKVIRRVAQVVNFAHSSRDQVLHRDIKPGNVVFDGYEYEDTDPNDYVFIVDFDLCWHKYATAETVVHHEGSRGYAAPEMFDHELGSTRKATVDVYSLGLLLYFTLIGKHPVPGLQDQPNFETNLAVDLRTKYRMEWSALGWHIARAISVASNTTPENRCTVSDFVALLDTAIGLVEGKQSSDYIPILGMQVMEDALQTGAEVSIADFGRRINHRRGPKELEISLSGNADALDVFVVVRVTKNAQTEGSKVAKRDGKVGSRIQKAGMDNRFEVNWIANASKRESHLRRRIQNVDRAEVKKLGELIRYCWTEIEKDN